MSRIPRAVTLLLLAGLSFAAAAACRGTGPMDAATSAQSPAAATPGAAPAATPEARPAPRSSHGAAPADVTVEPVAPPPGGMSIADVWAKRATLAGREVTVRGKVVKVNNQILGMNWLHLQDGSGSAEARTHDLTITTGDEASVGDVITVTGVLAIDKDFGAGYAYAAILEQGRILK